MDSGTTPKDALRIARNLVKQIPAGGGEPVLSPVDAATNKLFGTLGISFEEPHV